jgi:autotransporter-associated beta strand protein
MWLGRSEYGDQDASASYDEVRIFNTALTLSQLTALDIAGPDAYLGPDNLLPVTTPLKIAAGATLDLNGGLQQVASLSDKAPGSGGIITNSNASAPATLTISSASGTPTTFSGVIQGTISLVVSGSGTQVLAGANSYMGPTTIFSGTLKAAAAGALSPNSAVTVNGGVLDATGFAQTVPSLTIASGALNLTLGDPLTCTGAASFAGTLNLFGAGSGTIGLIGYSSYSGGFGNVTLGGGALPGADSLDYTSNELYLIAAAAPSVWTNAINGNWSDATKWTGPVPNGAGQGAVFSQPTGGTVTTITLDEPVTIGTLQLGNTASKYAINGTNTLTLNNNGAASLVTVSGGTQAIGVPLEISGGNLSVLLSNGGSLTMSNNVSDDNGNIVGDSRSLTLGGDGTGELVLSGANNTYGGGTTVTAGTLVVNNSGGLLSGSNLSVGTDLSAFPSAVAAPVAGSSAAPSSALAAVPEPSTLALLIAAMVLGFGVWRRRKGI